MSDKYENAPLVYVTALIRTSALPKLTKDQTALLEQGLIQKGLIHTAMGVSTTFHFGQTHPVGESESSTSSNITAEVSRKGFFSQDKKTCLILGNHGIEWRTSNYSTYSEFRESFSDLVGLLVSLVESFGSIVIEELTLSYSDVIAPLKGRSLSEYFVKDSHILPLSFFASFPDFQQAGTLQVTRVTSPTEKINILLEQLPTLGGKITKLIPNSVLEPDKDFGMPINIKKNWSESEKGRDYYALVLTQASSLINAKLKEYSERDLFESVHKLTSETFRSLINNETCDVDWQLISVRENV